MKNVLILMFAQISVKLLGLIYRLVITNAEGFGNTGLGYYSTGYQIYSLLLALSSIGIPSVVSKMVSERIAIGDNKGAQRVFKISMTFFVSLGLAFSLLLFFAAEPIATLVFNVPDVKYVMQVLAPAIVFVAASAVFRGYFAGQNDMKPTSASQILEQFFNCVLSITFVYALIGKEPYIMAAGGNLSSTLAIIITFLYLILYYKRRKLKVNKKQISPERNKTNGQLLKAILAMSIPITISSVISVVNPIIDSSTVSRCIQTAFASIITGGKEALEQYAMNMTGILAKMDTLVGLPVAINVAFSTALTPAIAAAIAKKDYKTASKRLSFSLFSSLIIVLPCAVGFIALAQPILNLIYPSASDGASILMLYSISMIFIALSQTINGGLYGLNKTKTPAIALAVGALIKFILNIILISNPNIGIIGAGISSIVCQTVAFTICFTSLRKSIKLNLNFKDNIIKPIISALTMGVLVYFIDVGLSKVINANVATIISIIFGVIIYVAMILLTKTLTKEDILMIPFGTKIYPLLVKAGIYKEKAVYEEENETENAKDEAEEVELSFKDLYSDDIKEQTRETMINSANENMEHTQPLNIAEIKLALDNNNKIRAEDIENLIKKTKIAESNTIEGLNSNYNKKSIDNTTNELNNVYGSEGKTTNSNISNNLNNDNYNQKENNSINGYLYGRNKNEKQEKDYNHEEKQNFEDEIIKYKNLIVDDDYEENNVVEPKIIEPEEDIKKVDVGEIASEENKEEFSADKLYKNEISKNKVNVNENKEELYKDSVNINKKNEKLDMSWLNKEYEFTKDEEDEEPRKRRSNSRKFGDKRKPKHMK